uniref:DNA polymerase III subunit beta n=1 Tax=Paulinella micropora TaxID=1928728 RepID=A0A385I090_9EUKA|nr:DNA polymerase III subunit beta [Paulinella micropora]AXY63343.1 DNA polymerase III subunit beta [Paulinella micropora]
MKLLCSQTELHKSLQFVSRAVATRPTIPILNNILLNADAGKGQLSIIGFDLSLGIQANLPASVEESGTVALPSRLFGEIISKLSDETPLSISNLNSNNQIEINSFSGTYQVHSIPADIFPKLPVVENGIPIRLEAESLIRGLRATLFASSNDEAKQILTGVHLQFNGQELECVATDGHRLAVLRLTHGVTDAGVNETGVTPENYAVTLPTRSLKELERLLSGCPSKEDIKLLYNEGQAMFIWSNQTLTSRTLEGIYPSYQNLIPTHFAQSITLDRKALIVALERVAVLAGKSNNIVKFICDSESNKLYISTDAQDIGSASESITVDFNGAPLQIAFNVQYLLDGLKVIADEIIQILCNASDTPAILTSQAEVRNFTYLIMPVQIRD